MIDKWLEPSQVTTYDLQMEFWLQRLYGRDIYFGPDLMKKYKILKKTIGVQEPNGTLNHDQLEMLIPELEGLYLESKERELHERHFSD